MLTKTVLNKHVFTMDNYNLSSHKRVNAAINVLLNTGTNTRVNASAKKIIVALSNKHDLKAIDELNNKQIETA